MTTQLLEFEGIVVDLRPLLPKARKHSRPWIADLTSGITDEVLADPHFKGGFAGGVFSPTGKIEAFGKDALAYLQSRGRPYLEVKAPKFAFTFPQIMAPLFNEYFYALHEGLAPAEDLDQAMKFGVNYPLGLGEWARKSDLESIRFLMQHLKEVTGDKRYELAPGFGSFL